MSFNPMTQDHLYPPHGYTVAFIDAGDDGVRYVAVKTAGAEWQGPTRTGYKEALRDAQEHGRGE